MAIACFTWLPSVDSEWNGEPIRRTSTANWSERSNRHAKDELFVRSEREIMEGSNARLQGKSCGRLRFLSTARDASMRFLARGD